MKDLSQYILTLPIVINFSLLIIMLYQCRRYFGVFLKGKTPLILSLIFAISFVLRVTLVTPKHLLYNDEFYYMFAAKNLILHGNFGSYSKSLGWPFINTILFIIFGINNWTSIYASILFGALTSINIFFIIYFIFQNKYIAILSSLVFALMPAHILWSATAETNVISVFFVTLCILASLLYFKLQEQKLLWLTLLLISFTAQIRGENYFLFGLFILGSLIFIRRMPNFRKNIWFISICVSLPNLFQIIRFQFSTNWLEKESMGALQGQNVSFYNLYYNTLTWAPRLIDGSLFPRILVLLFLIGFIFLWFRKPKLNLFLFFWFLAFYVIHFSAWFQVFGNSTTLFSKTRYYISFYPVLIIWSAAGISFFAEKIKYVKPRRFVLAALFLATVLSFISYLNIEGARNPEHRLETEIIEKAEKQLSSECIIVANYPEVLSSTTSLRVVDITDFLNDKALQDNLLRHNRCVLFFEDYFCIYTDNRNNCRRIRDLFNLEPFRSYSIVKNKKSKEYIVYTFYKIIPKAK